MNPQITNFLEDNHHVLRFTLTGANVSIANAIRRVILSEIPICCIRTDTNTLQRWDMCHILVNTSRLHNEILKQRLSLIPIHTTNLELLPNQWELVIDVTNHSEKVIYVTTEDFRLRKKNQQFRELPEDTSNEDTKEHTSDKTHEEWMPLEQVRQLFPPCLLGAESDNFIDFARLRPSNGTGIPGERLYLVADFGVATAKENSMYNAISCCTYKCTIDETKKAAMLDELLKQWRSADLSEEEIKFRARNFELLDAQRYTIPNSFEFQIQSIGIYTNEQLLWMAIQILYDRFLDDHTGLMVSLQRQQITIHRAVCTIPNCWDIRLDNEDYTFGKLLELIIYEECFLKQKLVTFCSFKKLHPHDHYGILRVALKENSETLSIENILQHVCSIGGHMLSQLLPKKTQK